MRGGCLVRRSQLILLNVTLATDARNTASGEMNP